MILTILSFITFAPVSLSGIVSLLLAIAGLIGVYVKQSKDIDGVKKDIDTLELIIQNDRQRFEKELEVLDRKLEAQGKIDSEILRHLSSIQTTQAVMTEKLSNLVDKVNSKKDKEDNNG